MQGCSKTRERSTQQGKYLSKIQGSKRKTSPAVQNARGKGRQQKGLQSLAEVKIMKALYVILRYLDTNIFSTVVHSHIYI